MQTIAVIDYGSSNLRSVSKALNYVADKHTRIIVSDEATIISVADKIVFPGQGAMGQCMRNLADKRLEDVLRDSIENKPFLGICLGLQSLLEESEEDNGTPGLGIIPGCVKKFGTGARDKKKGALKIPHMGWNKVEIKKKDPLFDKVDAAPYFYFVHSYYVVPKDQNMVATVTNYGVEFVSGIQYKNIYAFQFHPEKSQTMGLSLLERFSNIN